MRRSNGRRARGISADLSGAALAFLFEIMIVVSLAAVAFLIAAVVIAVN